MSNSWPLGSEVKRKPLKGGAILYDASRASNLAATWFDPEYWRARGELDGEARGRGAAYFIRCGERQLVLRHYRRGGLVARISRDRYMWRSEGATRAFAEWQLIYHLHHAGLPVPAPVGARYQRSGFAYTGDILTERLLGVESLATWLSQRPLPSSLDRDRTLHPRIP